VRPPSGPAHSPPVGRTSAWLRLAVVGEAGLVMVAGALGWWMDAPPFARFRWELGGLAWGIGATAPLLLALRWCLRTRWGPVTRLVALVEENLGPVFAGATPVELALLALLAGIGEEVLFRGVVQEAVAGSFPPWVAVLAAGALFGLAHWVTATYAALAAVVGVYLGLLYLASGNLLAPIVTHALYDLVALSVLTRVKPAAAG